MTVLQSAQKVALDLGTEVLVHTTPFLAKVSPVRHAALWAGEKYIRFAQNGSYLAARNAARPSGVIADRAEFGRAILHTADRVFSRELSPAVIRRLIDNMARGIALDGNDLPAKSRFFEKHGTYPPGFLTISPGKACNLDCVGCYASAGEKTAEKLSFDTFNRIITEAKTLWGMRFIVISGGEPLAYRSEGKGILDAAEKHPDIFFMMYTNGTLITDRVAERMAELGNISPAFSLEGWRERTDERRGTGVFDKVVEAMGRLRQIGVPFGISLTATRHNAEEILSDEFMDFCFEEQGALYGWLFHYMPIGRSFTLDLMPTPEQRKWMWQRVWNIIRERHIFLADFWNHGTASDGCLAAGRTRGNGYFYIDWNGSVTPCVFVPYSPVNINDLYKNNRTLNDIWTEPFFSDIRKWQENYWQGKGNWLAPCIIRDHHVDLRQLIAVHEPDPADESARTALLDPDYANGLAEYGEQHQALSGKIWDTRYLKDKNRWNNDKEY
jgi:MoaA/NifB/PqqE/SkfB family radical SAM enzyme